MQEVNPITNVLRETEGEKRGKLLRQKYKEIKTMKEEEGAKMVA